MKTQTHILYWIIIIIISVLFVLKKTRCEDINQEIGAQAKSQNQTPRINWTYGMDYERLIPINELMAGDPELKQFIKKLNSIFRKKEWNKIIEISNKAHYEEQGTFLGNDTMYVYNNISIYSHWEQGVVIKNKLSFENTSGFESLDQIKTLTLIGRNPEKSYGETYDYFGYIEKENGIILAVYFSITKRTGEYELTGDVG